MTLNNQRSQSNFSEEEDEEFNKLYRDNDTDFDNDSIPSSSQSPSNFNSVRNGFNKSSGISEISFDPMDIDESYMNQINNKNLTSYQKFKKNYLDPNYGLILTLISQFFNSIMIVCCKFLFMDTDFEKPLHPLHILFVRMVVTYIFCLIYMWYFKIENYPWGPRRYRLYLIGRGLGGFLGVFGQYYALIYLTVSDVTVLTFLSPTVTAIMAWWFLKERYTKIEAIGGIVSFIGVILIARPYFIFGAPIPEKPASSSVVEAVTEGAAKVLKAAANAMGSSSSSSSNDRSVETTNPMLRLLGSASALSSVFGTGVAMCCIRKVGFNAHPLISVTYFSFITLLISFFGILLVPGLQFEIPTTYKQWILLSIIGFTGFFMQFLLTAGMQREKAARAIAMCYTQMVYAIFWDFLFWDHLPNPLSLLGSTIIIGAALCIIYYKPPPQESDTNGNSDAVGSGGGVRARNFKRHASPASENLLDDFPSAEAYENFENDLELNRSISRR
ncbi:hypothetical protein B5S28_g815 [[Candida] boidinii]|nr:hypothetical protein B5S28_g815 [[Candida] boidinii]OWB64141.1 hypothetical protein B5S29_g5187 [[Candida] boidinii]